MCGHHSSQHTQHSQRMQRKQVVLTPYARLARTLSIRPLSPSTPTLAVNSKWNQEEVVHVHLRHRRDTLGVFETLMHIRKNRTRKMEGKVGR